MERPKFFYVTYPLPIDMADAFPVPDTAKPEKEQPAAKSVPMGDEKDFEPQWYGNARFPEDE